MTECSICVEAFNKTTRSEISCIKCDHVCCKMCFKRYITDPEHYLRCMGCAVEFDRSSLNSRLGQTFMRNVYRDIRQSVLYELEKAMFPATQEVVEQQLEIRKIRKRLDGLDDHYEQIRKDRTAPLLEFRHSEKVMKVSDVLDVYLKLQLNIEVIDEQLHDERRSLMNKIEELDGKKESNQKKTYVLACTKTDCKGMLSIQNVNEKGHYVCAICDSTTCEKCQMGIEVADHECDPDVMKTVEYMRTTSKPCPACGIPIHKISGCDQMFCTSCHASFSWTTLRLNTGAIHNPHHAAWLRENQNRPREVGDIQCGRELDMDIVLDLNARFQKEINKTKLNEKEKLRARDDLDYLFEASRMCIHHTHISINSLNNNRHGHHTNQILRIDLLMGNISETDFKREIQRRDKSNAKRNELLQVVMTYRDAMLDILAPFTEIRSRKTLAEWLALVAQIKALVGYVDECFVRVADAYNSTNPYQIMSDRAIR